MNNNTNNTKDQPNNDVTSQKPNVSKCDRDLYRVCPSKLSKRELENLYFALFENNLELKKTLHSQTEKLKQLSTKLQRMTVLQRNAAGKERDCCNSRVLVGEQRDVISDLKRANDLMSEKVRLLNMRLSSAKQFLKKSTCHSVRCPKCGVCPVNWSATAINARPSQASVKVNSISTASQYFPTENPQPHSSRRESHKHTRTVGTETEWNDNHSEKHCNENKCRTIMDELKQKIVNLQEELSNTHKEYSNRISRLESDVSSLQRENTSVKAAAATSAHRLQRTEQEARGSQGELRRAQGSISELTMQLSIERRRVKELETALKLASKPSEVARLIDKFNANMESKPDEQSPSKRVAVAMGPTLSSASYFSAQGSTKQDLHSPASTTSKSNRLLSPAETKSKDVSKSDDSGYAELNKSTDADDNQMEAEQLSRANREMMKKISELQEQVDTMRIKGSGAPLTIDRMGTDIDIFADEKQMAVITILDDRPDAVVQIQDAGAKNYDSKPERDIDTSTPVKTAIKLAESKSKMAERKPVIAEIESATSVDNPAEYKPATNEYGFETADTRSVKAENKRQIAEKNPVTAENNSVISNNKPIDGRDFETRDLSKSGIDECKPGIAPCNPETLGCKPGVTECKPSTAEWQSVKNDEPSTSAKADADEYDSWSQYMTKTTTSTGEKFKRRLIGQDIDVTIDISVEKTTSNVKRNDADNKYQIPGPMPCDTSRETKNKKSCQKCRSCNAKRVVCECKGAKVYQIEIDNSTEMKTDAKTNETPSPPSKSGHKLTIIEPDKGSLTPKDSVIIALKAKESKKLCNDNTLATSVDSFALNEKRLSQSSNIADLSAAIEKPIRTMNKAVEKANELERKYEGSVNDRLLEELAEVKEPSNTSYHSRGDAAGDPPLRDIMAEVTSWKDEPADVSAKSVDGASIREDKALKKFEQCLSRATACSCPPASRRDVNVFRTCSGSLRFHTSVGAEFRHCDQCSMRSAENNRDFTPNDMANDLPDWANTAPKIILVPKRGTPTSPRDQRVRPSGETSLIPRELGVILINQPDEDRPKELVEKMLTKRDTTSGVHPPPVRFESGPTVPGRRDSATYTASPPRKDSATYTAPPARRDSATYTTRAPDRLESAGFTPAPGVTKAPPARRDSATFPVTPPARRNSATYTGAPQRKDSATFTRPCVAGGRECECRCSLATSPDDTEREISSLPDLPPEKEGGASPWSRRPSTRGWATSPGELVLEGEGGTCTPTDTESSPRAAPLSAGEIPIPTQTRARKLSFGEKSPQPYSGGRLPPSSERQMEMTLNAISAELAHCRQLLQAAAQREPAPQEPQSTGSITSLAPRPEKVHALHAAPNSRRLPDTAPHTAVFTMHIGTLVLSDEAVLKFRSSSLCLAWQFWDQPAAMSRLRAGRVVLFDFSTEYDVPFSDEFLTYMKQEEMPISICDMNRPDEPLATCSLPLRDALIHTNRRANMSLALVAGPAMRVWAGAGTGSVAGGAGDELGVLDLWCSLRAPPRLRTAINTAIARNSNVELSELPLAPTASRNDFQSNDDEDSRNHHDFLYRPRRKSTQVEGPDFPGDFKRQKRISSLRSLGGPSDPVIGKDARDYEPKWRPSFGLPKQRSSGTIDNEVFSNIRSPDEMRQAIEKTDVPYSQYSRLDDEISQAHSSMGSLKNMADKHRAQKQSAMNAKTTSNIPEGLQDLIKAERKISTAATVSKQIGRMRHMPFGKNSRDDEPDPAVKKYTDTFQKYSNSTTSGLNRMIEAKKTVTYTDDRIPTLTQAKDSVEESPQSIDVTVLWLALNEECEAMVNPQVQRLYVAYTFLGRRGADLETPVSLPKPKHYADKCFFNFKKTLQLHDADLPLLGHMSRCRAGRAPPDPRDCLVFSVVSEPQEDPLGLSCCEDIGHAYLYLGDILAYSAGGAGYTEVVPVRAAPRPRAPARSSTPGYAPPAGAVCGVLAVRVDGLHVLRRCLSLSHSNRDLSGKYA